MGERGNNKNNHVATAEVSSPVIDAFLDYVESLKVGELIQTGRHCYIERTRKGFRVVHDEPAKDMVERIKYTVTQAGMAKVEMNQELNKKGRSVNR